MQQRPAPDDLPAGLTYVPDFVDSPEAARLFAQFEALRFDRLQMNGVIARREVLHFGYTYGYDNWRVEEGPAIPEFLLHLRSRAAAFVVEDPDTYAEALLTRYTPGATIGWHRDAPSFGPTVLGLSFGAAATLRFRTGTSGRAQAKLTLEPGSLYVLSGEARRRWQHALSPVKGVRYSVTFRTVRRSATTRPSTPHHPD